MTDLWPWLAVAGLGILHGLNPTSGWMFAAARGVQAREGAQVRRALLPLAIGHAASIAIVAGAFAQGLLMDRARFKVVAGALLLCLASYRCLSGVRQSPFIGARARHAGIALWSFLMASAHGAGLMLVPALVPLCLADAPGREITASGALLPALSVVGIHMAATLGTTGIVAAGVWRGMVKHSRRFDDTAIRKAWTAVLIITGVGLMVFR